MGSNEYRPRKLTRDFIITEHVGAEQSMIGIFGVGSELGLSRVIKKLTTSIGRPFNMSATNPANSSDVHIQHHARRAMSEKDNASPAPTIAVQFTASLRMRVFKRSLRSFSSR